MKTSYHPAHLKALFVYYPPTEETAPHFAAISSARAGFEESMDLLITELENQEEAGQEPSFQKLHEIVSQEALEYAEAVNEHGVGWESQNEQYTVDAIQSITLARMWMNKAIRAPKGGPRRRLIALAMTESEKAQLLANCGIATEAGVDAALA